MAGLLLAQAPEGSSPISEDAPRDEAARPDAVLGRVLDRLDRLSALYRDQALQFACNERITYVDEANKHEVHDFEYIYVYDEGRGFLDYRTLPGAGLRKGEPPAEIDPAVYKLPLFMRRAYSWIFIFERGKRAMYRYSLEGEEILRGRRVARVGFEPIQPYEPEINDWIGAAWVDEDSIQILRIEAQKVTQHDKKLAFERLRSGADPIAEHEGEIYSFSEIATDFKVQKNGLAFPESIELTRRRCKATSGARGIKSTCWSAYSVTQQYTNFRFFGIKTSDEIQQLLSGEPAAAVPPSPP